MAERGETTCETLDRWAMSGVYVKMTTPYTDFARFYIARWHEREAYWEHLFEYDYWQRFHGGVYHVKRGTTVTCPTFSTPSEAIAFGLQVEKRTGYEL